jgi:hypothetical protein
MPSLNKYLIVVKPKNSFVIPSLEKNFKIENSRFGYFPRPLFIEGGHDERLL